MSSPLRTLYHNVFTSLRAVREGGPVVAGRGRARSAPATAGSCYNRPIMDHTWAHVFDLGNVLIFVHEERFHRKLIAACDPEARAEQAFFAAFDEADVGRGGDFEAIHPALVRTAGLRLTADEFQLAWNDIFTRNPPMLEVLRATPRPRVLLSNTNAPHVAWIAQQFPEVLPLFDQCVFSHEVGLAKPDPAIYRRVESLTGLPPERHLFTDDIAENVEAARACGWRAHRFREAAGYRKWLEEIGDGLRR
jgi:HAD superfamily hydrolase (TIGR01509 family)